jgi:hypothetical protein
MPSFKGACTGPKTLWPLCSPADGLETAKLGSMGKLESTAKESETAR